mmetsp:Transcript_27550/g.80435  ORF Transcript_27550/g.80435 Transcript_27550/m.80435 type:complete len:217 (+) Transcript_27550:1410-2060(+)
MGAEAAVVAEGQDEAEEALHDVPLLGKLVYAVQELDDERREGGSAELVRSHRCREGRRRRGDESAAGLTDGLHRVPRADLQHHSSHEGRELCLQVHRIEDGLADRVVGCGSCCGALWPNDGHGGGRSSLALGGRRRSGEGLEEVVGTIGVCLEHPQEDPVPLLHLVAAVGRLLAVEHHVLEQGKRRVKEPPSEVGGCRGRGKLADAVFNHATNAPE